MQRVAPYGTWASPLSARDVAAGALRLVAVSIDGDDIYWVEGRPTEGGRYVLVRRGADGTIADAIPAAFNVRSRVHEYGGGAYAVADGEIFFVNFADQRVYRIGGSASRHPPSVPGSATRDALSVPLAITPPGAWRYADLVIDAPRRRLIGVREDHSIAGREPVNTVVSIPIPFGESAENGDALSPGDVLVSGDDFYSTPRLSPDGSRLAWISWRHPRMPWDGTELWVAEVTAAGTLTNALRLAGGETESIYQPGWSPDGELYYASDRDGWWALYRSDRSDRSSRSGEPVLVHPCEGAEFGRPEWVFGTATWACAGPSRLVVSYTRAGTWHLATIDLTAGTLAGLAPGLQPHEWLAATATHAVVVAGWATRPDAVVRIDLASGETEVLLSAS
jgi:hypothetical protein